MPGSPGMVLIPLGRLQASPKPLLAHGALLLTTRVREPEAPMLVPNEEPKKSKKPRKTARVKRHALQSHSIDGGRLN